MEKEILNSYSKLENLNVSRETYLDFELFISMLIEKNREINIISQESSKDDVIRERHIIDSAQIIDFVDLNQNTTTDLGSGGGMPGIVMAIMMKKIKKDMKILLYEKSHHKSMFLKSVSRELNLDTKIIQKDIFEIKEIKSGTIMARAFKPLPIVLDLVYKNFSNYKNLIMFMGKNGRRILNETSDLWDFDYTEKQSLTSEDSFIINIKNIKKKIIN